MYAFLYDLQTYNNFKPALLSCLIKCFFFFFMCVWGYKKITQAVVSTSGVKYT